ncbi:hypothetical protein DFR49_0820 [Hephaestia caeni]|uniref:Uncharacterized protein n=1 Tax=Hephaestia caeni TaxID=645617 RepID=A0A397PJF5_9SPHN|nr:hypothetical protein [Hephaestia caeni]RIA46284.1 hypothetical protein DFR49_0820 [Hephaestia caeni]
MTGRSRGYALSISAPLFQLATEAIRVHSNATGRFQSLAQLVIDRVHSAPILEDHDPAILRDHLRLIPSKGDVQIYLSLPREDAVGLIAIKKQLSEKVGQRLLVEDTLSLVLLDSIAADRASEVLRKVANPTG